MDWLFEVDWSGIVVPTYSLAEMIVRGTLMYLALFIILRFILNRQAGALGIADILVIVVIADAAQNGFAKDYHSVTEGVVLVLTIVFWNYAIDWLGYRVPALASLLEPPPLLLIKDGHLIRKNLREEFITPDELMSQLRQQGIEKVSEVKAAYLEGDGQFSVIRKSFEVDSKAGGLSPR